MDKDVTIREIQSSPYIFVLGKKAKDEMSLTLASTIISRWSISEDRAASLADLDYKEYLETDEWKAIRKFMREVFPYCSCCGSAKALHVHHNNYPSRGSERPIDLTVLCCVCHMKIHEINEAEEHEADVYDREAQRRSEERKEAK